MKAKPIEQVVTISTGLSVGVTLKAKSKDTPVPFDKETLAYHKQVETIGRGFKKLGWHVTQQVHEENEYLVCAKYALDTLDFKYIESATKIIKDCSPAWLHKDHIRY